MFGGGEQQKGFERTVISGTERTLSWLVLLVVAGIATGIYLKGRSFDPGLFSLDQELLTRSVQPVRQQMRLTEQADGSRPQTRVTGPRLAGIAPEGWAPMGQVERFAAGDLYVKINGRAEQYLAYDVVGLTCVSMADVSERFLDLFVYDMGAPIRAFGIYSAERAEGQPAVDLGRGGYRSAASIFFWKGPYYVQVIAGGNDEPLRRAADDVANELAGRLADGGEPVWGLSAFPADGLIKDSIQYVMRDALSMDFLGNTFTARYTANGSELTALLCRTDSEEKTAGLLDSYRRYLSDYGELLDGNLSGADETIVGDLDGTFDILFRQGTTVGGVTTAENRDAAEQTALTLLSSIQQASD